MKRLTPDSPELKSADLVAENLERLRELFPEAFANEGKIDFDVLRQLLGDRVDEGEERYGLNWHGKRAARQLALTPSTGTLRPCLEESVDWDTTQNIFIEGDNLEVLKLLQKSYAGKVKLIYIDPPYNTGKDFVYPDNYQESIRNYLEITGQIEGGQRITSNTEANGRFHTDWLRMMLPRLKLAHGFLKPSGIMMVSIADDELTNLRQLLDELYGRENFIACITWEKGRKNDAKLLSVGHEYIVIYAKSLATLRQLKTTWREEKPGAREIWDHYTSLRQEHGPDDERIERDLTAWFASLPTSHPSKKWSRYRRVDDNGPWRDRDISWPGGGGPTYDVVHPRTGHACAVPEAGWRFASPDEMQRQIALGLVVFREDHTEPPFRKAHLKPIDIELSEGTAEEEECDDDAEDEGLATQVRGTYFYKQSQVAVKALRQLLGAKVFNNPKDHVELSKLIGYVTDDEPNAIVMDFFAGSGSTAHAVMEMNSRQGSARRFVLVQLPEPLNPTVREQRAAAAFCDRLNRPRNIAELTKHRLSRAIEEIADRGKELHGLGFRVFKLDAGNVRPWEASREALAESLAAAVDHVKPDRTEDDLLYDMILKHGLDLCAAVDEKQIGNHKVRSVGGGAVFTCFGSRITAADVEQLADGIA